MSLAFFLQPRDREWFGYGLGVLLISAWILASLVWRRWSFPAKMKKLIVKNPSLESDIEHLFEIYRTKRFSVLCKLVGLSWISFGFIMIALGYLTDTGYEFPTFYALLYVFSAALIFTGLHVWVNSLLYNALNIIENSDVHGLDVARIRSLKTDYIFGGFVAAFFILPALYLLSCLLFKYPFDLYHLAINIQKWGSS